MSANAFIQFGRDAGKPNPKVQEPRIPIPPLKALILRWAKEHDITDNGIKQGQFSVGSPTGTGWRNHLAELSGLNYRTIYKLVSTEGWLDKNGKWIDHVTFDTADKLTSAMECNQEWTSGCLAGFYGPLSVKKYERHLEGVL